MAATAAGVIVTPSSSAGIAMALDASSSLRGPMSGNSKSRSAYPGVGSSQGRARPFWGFWDDYPKVTLDGSVYADIAGRLYTQHAVERMSPSSLGTAARPGGSSGRSVSPAFVEEILTSNHTVSTPVSGPNGEPRTSHIIGTVEVITEDVAGHEVVITIITR